MDWSKIHIVYFIGIGGIGMSALARHFNFLGKQVTGYDRTKTRLTHDLESEGISIHYTPNIQVIPKDVDLVIYTPAIPNDFEELVHCKEQQYLVMKRAEVLGLITRDATTIAVGGTHGKTTVSCMVAQMLKSANRDITAFLGGISLNFNSNYVPGGDVVVVEADEYDRSFHTLLPNIAVVTSMDADHLDIYGSHENLIQSFGGFISKIESNGLLLLHHTLVNDITYENTLTYSLYNNESDIHTSNIEIEETGYTFDVVFKNESIPGFKCSFGGKHNIENALVAIAIGKQLNLSHDELRNGIETFRGVKRRFEYHLRGSVIYIDDYAHHPSEIEALLLSVKELHPTKRITAIFQPHLYSRTQDFVEEFAKSLDLADEVLLLNIYPARELPIPGVTSQLILNALSVKHKRLIEKSELEQILSEKGREVVLSIGAGDIDECVMTIKSTLKNLNS